MSRNHPEEDPKFPKVFQLGDFSFFMATKELRDASRNVVHLRSQTAEVLAHLLHHRGEVVSKQELFDRVWVGRSVTDDSLVQCISEIRRCLNDRNQTIVETVTKKGYRVHAVPAPSMPEETGLPLPSRPSIAVLAFEDFSAGTDSGYLSDAIAEGIIAELSRFSELFVIARNSSFSFRNAPINIQDIERKLGVRYVLEGSQQKAGEQLRVTVQLIDALAGHHLWTDVYDRQMNDLFDVQDDIVRRVVATVAQKVIRLEGRSTPKPEGTNHEALLHHFAARQHLIKFTPQDNEKARIANLAAIKADPTQPYGYVGLAFTYIIGHRWGWGDMGRPKALDAAREAARKALELAPDYYDGHAAMAFVHLQENDLERAIARAQQALELNPNDTNVMSDLADYLGYAGRLEEAEHLLQKAMRLDPLHPDWFRWNMAWIKWLGGDFEDALRFINAMTEVPPMANRVLAIVYQSLGRQQEAREAIDSLIAFDPEYSIKDVYRNDRGKFSDVSNFDRLVDSLRAAGLPD